KPHSAILANARKSSVAPGTYRSAAPAGETADGGAGASGTGMVLGYESVVRRARRAATLHAERFAIPPEPEPFSGGCPAAPEAACRAIHRPGRNPGAPGNALFLSTLGPYIQGAGASRLWR